MATYHFKHNNSVELPIADDEYFTGAMNDLDSFGECYIAFYDSDGNIVTPDSGTIEFFASPIDGQYLAPAESASIDATTVGADATYTPPSFNSTVIKTKVKFTGITGATIAYAKASHWRGR